MGLSQDIVVKSRFSVPLGHGTGSRGGTPGKFILRYMSRDLAGENIAPTRLNERDSNLAVYDRRQQAVNEGGDISTIRHKMQAAQRRGGVAFGDGNPSLSEQKLREVSRDIQSRFDRGKTAIETVLSFTEDYLRENGVLDPDFVHEKRGDFAGHVDQLKLRMAIMNGLQKMSRNFDDLHYVGVIQVDTNHVHCHLTMMDYGRGTIMPDGTQKGKLSALDKKNLRRGIDTFLDEKQSVKMMASSVMYDKRNALCYIKAFAHKTMAQQGIPQFLLACLPENRNHWSANSNRVEMRKPNAIVREFVVDLLQPNIQSPSPMYRKVHESIVQYADTRQKREGLSESDRMKLIRNGEEQVIRDCMNGVYAVLKQIPKERMTVRTPMMDAMSMDYESMAVQAVNDPMMEFGFRLRSYSSRLREHRKLYHRFKDEHEAYERAENKSEEAKALGDHLALERDYQQMLMVKYQHFLTFLPPDEDIEDEFDDLMRQRSRLEKMNQMEQDQSMRRMGQIAADQYGRRVYGIGRGYQIWQMPDVWDRRKAMEQRRLDEATKQFKEHLQDYGMDFDGHGVTRQKLYPFDEVKALDLHHLGYDFPMSVPISKRNADVFIEFANRRYESFQRARDYLERTGQSESVVDLLPTDVRVMKQFADKLAGGQSSLASIRPGQAKKHTGLTVPLGRDYTVDMKAVVRATIEATRSFE